ncbi:uncharacterized protein C13orf42 [Alosa sapidissima]|uniref:uncharacterized protein C13orf42 n=1 Tax=Alosa sapidissima TaxID=34773 RepID=UPI001C096821|nr:uncharacterized protein C13orf42 [Alosa sapidissima]
MFRKINAVFRPNHGHRGREDDYHSACTVKLVRSTSMLVVGEARGGRASRTQRELDATLKRSKSSVTLESTSTSTTSTTTALFYYHTQQDQIWLYSQNQDCLQYLQELVALRRQYTQSIMNIQNAERRNSLASEAKKKAAPQPPRAKAAPARAEPTAPPIPNEEDTLQFLDSVIASCDPEPRRKPNMDDGHADVDFVVATSTSEHDLHSNWVMRDPRRFSMDESRLRHPEPKLEPGPNPPTGRRKGQSGTASGRRLQRNPIHLPKVVESAFQTLRFKPKLKKKD